MVGGAAGKVGQDVVEPAAQAYLDPRCGSGPALDGAGGPGRSGRLGIRRGVGEGEGEGEFSGAAGDPTRRTRRLRDYGAGMPVDLVAQHRQVGVVVEVQPKADVVVADQNIAGDPVLVAVALPGVKPS